MFEIITHFIRDWQENYRFHS